jgi:hypothetical protein
MLCCIYSGDGDGFLPLHVLEVSCVTGLPARTARPFVPSFFAPCPHSDANHIWSRPAVPLQSRSRTTIAIGECASMKNLIQRRWAMGAAVFVLTAASYAQWSNPAEDVPAYHASAPLKVTKLPPILQGAQLTGEHFVYPWQKFTSTSRPSRLATYSTSCPATAAATAHWATPACAVALRMRTAPNATSVQQRPSSPTA